MAQQEDLQKARDYLSALISGDDSRLDAILRPYRAEGSGAATDPAGVINALARMVLLQAGPRGDMEEYINQVVRSLAAMRPYAAGDR